ncbi:MAG: LPS export ABC transporter permease LptG [Deltaproteobacteria bacterium]|nr:LPS export ABC transporter permease LptG [Deltaproteobacteria bacterium]
MRILSRYILREFLKFFAATLAGFTTIFYVIDFLDNVGDLVKYNAPFMAGALYYFYKFPQIVFYAMPVAVLLATLFVLTILSRNNEIMAVRSNGISVLRAVVPLLLAALALSAFAFVNNEFLVPAGNAKSSKIYKLEIKRDASDVYFTRDNFWFRSENAIYNIGSFDYLRKALGPITIYRMGEKFRPVGRVDAKGGRWVDGRWIFYDVVSREFQPDGGARVVTAKEMPVDIPETPESFKVLAPDPNNFSYLDLKAYIEKIREDGYDPTKYLVDLQAKLSTPLISLLSCLIAIPFALRTTRAGQRPIGILLAIILASSYWFVLAYSLAFGRQGTFHPMLAAWLPNLGYALLGGALLFTVEE